MDRSNLHFYFHSMSGDTSDIHRFPPKKVNNHHETFAVLLNCRSDLYIIKYISAILFCRKIVANSLRDDWTGNFTFIFSNEGVTVKTGWDKNWFFGTTQLGFFKIKFV